MKTNLKIGYCCVLMTLLLTMSSHIFGQVNKVKEIDESIFSFYNVVDPNTAEMIKIIYPIISIEDGLWNFYDSDFNYYSFQIKNDTITDYILKFKHSDKIEERHYIQMEISSQPDTIKWFDFEGKLIKVE
jgi:hypothetical protein